MDYFAPLIRHATARGSNCTRNSLGTVPIVTGNDSAESDRWWPLIDQRAGDVHNNVPRDRRQRRDAWPLVGAEELIRTPREKCALPLDPPWILAV